VVKRGGEKPRRRRNLKSMLVPPGEGQSTTSCRGRTGGQACGPEKNVNKDFQSMRDGNTFGGRKDKFWFCQEEKRQCAHGPGEWTVANNRVLDSKGERQREWHFQKSRGPVNCKLREAPLEVGDLQQQQEERYPENKKRPGKKKNSLPVGKGRLLGGQETFKNKGLWKKAARTMEGKYWPPISTLYHQRPQKGPLP